MGHRIEQVDLGADAAAVVKVGGDVAARTETQGGSPIRMLQQVEQGLQKGGGIVGGYQPAADAVVDQVLHPGTGIGHHGSATGHRLHQAPAGHVGPAEIGMHLADAK